MDSLSPSTSSAREKAADRSPSPTASYREISRDDAICSAPVGSSATVSNPVSAASVP
jgi:hypothetical protein